MKKLSLQEIQQFTPPSRCPKLADLADHCATGACNVFALLKHLGEAVRELPFHEAREHPALPIIIGQISSLLGESSGPSLEAFENYEVWKAPPAVVVLPPPENVS